MSDDIPDRVFDAELVDDEQQQGEETAAAENNHRGIVIAQELLPETLHLLPLTERPFFPAQALPLLLNAEPWLPTLKAVAATEQRLVGLVLTRPAQAREQLHPNDFYSIGTVVRVHHLVQDEGKLQFIAQGLQRFRIVRWLSTETPYRAQVDYPGERVVNVGEEIRAYSLAVINTIKELIPLNPLYSEELKIFLNRFNVNEPSALADFAASMTTASREELQQVLSTPPLLARMKKVLVLLKKEVEMAKLQTRIRQQVEDKISDQQREFFLREQLKAIQKELGIAKDDRTADLDRFRERLDTRSVPEPILKRIDDEMEKLSVLESGSPEYAVTRNYLDVITDLPWGVHSTDNLDLVNARKVLDADHAGLDDVKDRIIEFLAVGALKGEVSGSIILLVGPPGVGKTSIGRSIAAALDRRFFRFSLGGMRDEAEIKGHRRTYIGAMPGKVAQALRETATANPVIMLDEIDKIGASYQGDPASALLEVLDPEQNSEFLDHYLDVRLDLSKVLFICTANTLDTIPSPLLDRMEMIRLAGYITSEKLAIGRRHLWPRLLKRSGLRRRQVRLSDAALKQVIEGYAREAGVRSLEKQLGRIVRKAAVRIVSDGAEEVRVGVKDLEEFLGTPFFQRQKPLAGVGVVTGLAWTSMGGATLSIEASVVHGKGRGFRLTGRLGDVMQESAAIAYSYIVSHLKEFKAPEGFFDEAYVHLHVPEGATPKDGPSAGVTMATALLSLARGARPDPTLAMTGELTLTGKVLAVGGIREKVIAARRSKLDALILPEANRGDYEELPEHIRSGLEVHFAGHFRDVARHAFGH